MAAPRDISKKILSLRKKGYSYNKIANKLNCSKSTVCYHCGIGQKNKSRNQTKKLLIKYPFYKKLEHFLTRVPHIYESKNHIMANKYLRSIIRRKLMMFERTAKGQPIKMSDTIIKPEDVLAKFGTDPKCYLTGKQLDWTKLSEYSFDHKIPVSKGGQNTLDNLEICSRRANQCKSDLTPEEFFDLCKEILEYNGYKVVRHPCQDSNLEPTL